MKFKEILRRYHISPLLYDDKTELEEKDYRDLYKLLTKYYYIRGELFSVDEKQIKKMEFRMRNSLIPLEPEEQLDVLMDIDSEVL